MSVLDRLTALFAPDDCLICGREGLLLCRACLITLPPVLGRCFGCSNRVAGVSCSACLAPTGLTSLTAVTQYAGASKQLVFRLKFQANQTAARLIAKAMAAHVSFNNDVVLTHVPATPAHIRERGYDQAALVTKQLSRIWRLPRATLLYRRGTAHQLGASRDVRHSQLTDAVRVARPSLVCGRRILLVDDVLTTGSSLTVATQVLLAAGATSVDALVFAQAIKNTR